MGGEKQSLKLIYWLTGLIATIGLSCGAWIGNGMVQAKTDIAVLNSRYEQITMTLKDMQVDLKFIRGGSDTWMHGRQPE